MFYWLFVCKVTKKVRNFACKMRENMKNWKLWLPDVVVVLLFVVISFAYFFPADIEGRVLYRHDSSAGRGAGQEAVEYQQRTGERTRWTNA